MIRIYDIVACGFVVWFASWLWAFEYRQKSSMVMFLAQAAVSNVVSAMLVAIQLFVVVPALFGLTWADVTIPPERKIIGPVLFALLLAPLIAMLYGLRLRRKAHGTSEAASSEKGKGSEIEEARRKPGA
jgi:hypothetical protein